VNINDLPGSSPERIPGSSRINTSQAKSGEAAEANFESVDSVTAQHTRDPELVGLVEKLNDSPEVRTDRIDAVKQQIQEGSFISRESAEATAKAFLR
jgi:anti-sigma28 factor (negative regulator of flagellin synthesis)